MDALSVVKAYRDILKLVEQNKLILNDSDQEIKGLQEELELSQSMAQGLITSERLANDMIQDARKVLIDELSKITPAGGDMVCVKRMGELDVQAFCNAVEKEHVTVGKRRDHGAIGLCSLWESYIKDSSWYPFKVINENGKSKEILDDDDEKLKSLKNELGMQVYEFVAVALKELNEFNPSGRFPVPRLWNAKEGREATIKEAIVFLMERNKNRRRKRPRQ